MSGWGSGNALLKVLLCTHAFSPFGLWGGEQVLALGIIGGLPPTPLRFPPLAQCRWLLGLLPRLRWATPLVLWGESCGPEG